MGRKDAAALMRGALTALSGARTVVCVLRNGHHVKSGSIEPLPTRKHVSIMAS